MGWVIGTHLVLCACILAGLADFAVMIWQIKIMGVGIFGEGGGEAGGKLKLHVGHFNPV